MFSFSLVWKRSIHDASQYLWKQSEVQDSSSIWLPIDMHECPFIEVIAKELWLLHSVLFSSMVLSQTGTLYV